ncbi:hypothetical protein Hanom_Chr10g00925251 [Helianthus anomalus]
MAIVVYQLYPLRSPSQQHQLLLEQICNGSQENHHTRLFWE